uniref:Response regulator receiver protein n=1 Tax=Cyanothece sp. (strain PCC 7425 / ATCC 29141) TaxID=395961 RepID=B8HZ43_CYAP4
MRVLIVDSYPVAGAALAWELEGYGVETRIVDTIARAEAEIAALKPDVLVTELFLQDGDYLALTLYRRLFPIILLTHDLAAYDADVKSTVDAYLCKPSQAIDLIAVAGNFISERPYCILRERESCLRFCPVPNR